MPRTPKQGLAENASPTSWSQTQARGGSVKSSQRHEGWEISVCLDPYAFCLGCWEEMLPYTLCTALSVKYHFGGSCHEYTWALGKRLGSYILEEGYWRTAIFARDSRDFTGKVNHGLEGRSDSSSFWLCERWAWIPQLGHTRYLCHMERVGNPERDSKNKMVLWTPGEATSGNKLCIILWIGPRGYLHTLCESSWELTAWLSCAVEK